MRPVSDALLLNIAEVSSALIGLFLVGMFFYIETGFRRTVDARSRGAVSATRSTLLATTEIVGTAGVVVLVTLPWALGGAHPTREDLTWAILLSFATGFMSICTAVLYAFDIARSDP
jgi:hypothetical protein